MNEKLDMMIGQMIMVGFRGTEVNRDSAVIKHINKYRIGGVWIVDNENPIGESKGNIQSAQQLKILTADLQAASDTPLLISIDAEGGRVIRLKEAYGFPKTYSAQYVGEKNNLEFTRLHSKKIAELLYQNGINLNLAPVVDLFINPHNPALGGKERCYSADPEKVLMHAREVIKVHHEHKILCCMKHFPGHGCSTEDTHIGFVDVTKCWRESELYPYENLIKEGLADCILTAHIYNKNFDADYPATLSKNILTRLLRHKLGFDGVIISDDMMMGAIRNNYGYEESIELAVNAGVDIVLHSNAMGYSEHNAEEIFLIIRKAVIEGRIPEERIEESYNRIMRLKTNVTAQ